MDGKIDRILENIRTNCGTESYDKIISACGAYDPDATPVKQANYVQKLIKSIDEVGGESFAEKVMTLCGGQCISDSIINKAKGLYKRSGDLDEFLRLLNENRIGGGQLHMADGKITGIYNKCYCGLASKAKGMSPSYCYCSAGWYKRLFSSIFGDQVRVIKVRTILGGSDKCIFEVII